MTAFNEGGNFPFLWSMTSACIDFDGKFKHFPRGTYYDQTKTSLGSLELVLMKELFATGKLIYRRSKSWVGHESELEKDIESFEKLGFTKEEVWGLN